MAKHRKHTRRGRKSRKTHRRRSHRRQRGGAFDIQPEMAGWKSAALSLPQGVQFAGMHVGQHGGGNMNMPQMGMNMPQTGGAAPVGYTGMLDDGLRAAARTDATMVQYNQIVGLKDPDQAGGRRRRRRGGRKSRKGRRRSQRGGALSPAPVGWTEAVSVPAGVNPQFKSWDASA
jgi:hypothetical protein